MNFLSASGTYIVTCKLSNDPKSWVHEPDDIVELNYMSPTGERRILMKNVVIDINQRNMLIIRARSQIGRMMKVVDLRLYRKSDPRNPGLLIDFWGVSFDLNR